MAHAGQELHGQDGYTLRLISIEPELLQMEATYGGTGQFPPRHYHPSQDEHFEVLEGTVRTIVDGEERSHEAGEMFDISAGTVHQLAADPPARLKWEVRPRAADRRVLRDGLQRRDPAGPARALQRRGRVPAVGAPTCASSQAFIGSHASQIERPWLSAAFAPMPCALGASRRPATSDLWRSSAARGWSFG